MKRRAFNVLAAVSLVMALAVAGLWARSVWWAGDKFDTGSMESGWYVMSAGGSVMCGYWTERGWNTPDNQYQQLSAFSTTWAPFRYAHGGGHAWSGTHMSIADWLLILIFSTLPAVWLVTCLRRRKPVGLCAKCGYDLRGSRGPACPECGSPIPAFNAK